MIGACLWVVQVPVTKTKKTVRKVKFPHTSIVFTLDPNSNKNNDDDQMMMIRRRRMTTMIMDSLRKNSPSFRRKDF